MPGPLAAQVCMWFGYLERGWLGALVVSLPFVLPAFLVTTIAAIAYAHYQGLGFVRVSLASPGPFSRLSPFPRKSSHGDEQDGSHPQGHRGHTSGSSRRHRPRDRFVEPRASFLRRSSLA